MFVCLLLGSLRATAAAAAAAAATYDDVDCRDRIVRDNSARAPIERQLASVTAVRDDDEWS